MALQTTKQTVLHNNGRDEDSDRVAQVVGQFEGLKSEIARYKERSILDGKMIAERDGEIAAMTREVANLRYRLAFHQNFGAKLSSSFSNVLAIMDEALRDASAAAQEQADVEQKHGSAERPAIEIPLFMQRMREENGIGQA